MPPTSSRPPLEQQRTVSHAAPRDSSERRAHLASGDGLQSWSGMIQAPPRERLPLLDRIAQKAGSTGRLSDAAKCLIVHGIMCLFGSVCCFSATVLNGWPFFGEDVLPVVRIVAPWTLASFAVWPLGLLYSLSRVRAQDTAPHGWLSHFTAIFFAGQLAFFSYITSPFSAPSGIVLLTGITTGLLLFERRVLVAGVLVYATGLCVVAYLSTRGFLPLRALYLASTTGRGLDTEWLLRSAVSTALMIMLAFPFLGMIVSSWRYRELRLERAAQTDALTGIFNRGYVMEVLDRTFARANEKRPLSVIMVDIDHFKKVNDAHGHLIGDEVLRQVAMALLESLRKNDTLGRFGGEEFLLVLPGIDDGGARVVAERCRAAVAALDFGIPSAHAGGGSLRVTASFGIASLPPFYATVETLLDVADAALYEAKRDGRNRVVSDRGRAKEDEELIEAAG